ncbi:hypothetical protein [Butyrivibrio sp. NC3005]|uniref:hypothetical protein n=1 Tax=Butyrivibrio sp. NC3005 TaxID=1280685 RepID=UPI00040F0DBF|nr:hypothetical protein [Butyrivibrio sp. NC3005]
MKQTKRQISISFFMSAFLVIMLVLISNKCGDYYFDLNDDVLMKNIISGNYTGSPASHNIQMLYPISLVISLFYRLFQGTCVYSIFLCLCQFVSLFIIIYRSITEIKTSKKKYLLAAIIFVFFLSSILGHLIFVQYTFTTAMLAGACATVILTGKTSKKDMFFACILVFLGFLIRSEMMLLMLPFLGIAWLTRFLSVFINAKEKNVLKKYLVWAMVLFAGLFVCIMLDKAAYSSPSWKEFRSFFDARTKLYDYYQIPEYEENKEFYSSIDMSKEQVELLFNYNFAIDDELNSQKLWEIADYAKSIHEETPFKTRIVQALKKYIWRQHNFSKQKSFEYPQTDAPWNIFTILLYLIVFLFSFIKERQKTHKNGIVTALMAMLLLIIRTMLWMYILLGERDPIRVTHGMLFVEDCILLAFMNRVIPENKLLCIIPFLACLAILAVYVPNQIDICRKEMDYRKEMNAPYNELYSQICDDSSNYYFVDVYASVGYSEKMYPDDIKERKHAFATPVNYDFCGGWAAKSPLQKEKLKKQGFENIKDALLQKNVYFVTKNDSSTKWLVAYYNSEGVDVDIREIRTVSDRFKIVKVELCKTKK